MGNKATLTAGTGAVPSTLGDREGATPTELFPAAKHVMSNIEL